MNLADQIRMLDAMIRDDKEATIKDFLELLTEVNNIEKATQDYDNRNDTPKGGAHDQQNRRQRNGHHLPAKTTENIIRRIERRGVQII